MSNAKKEAKKALSNVAVIHLERAIKSLKDRPTISVITEIRKALGIAEFMSEMGDGE